jgi:hypothetical protein
MIPTRSASMGFSLLRHAGKRQAKSAARPKIKIRFAKKDQAEVYQD